MYLCLQVETRNVVAVVQDGAQQTDEGASVVEQTREELVSKFRLSV